MQGSSFALGGTAPGNTLYGAPQYHTQQREAQKDHVLGPHPFQCLPFHVERDFIPTADYPMKTAVQIGHVMAHNR